MVIGIILLYIFKEEAIVGMGTCRVLFNHVTKEVMGSWVRANPWLFQEALTNQEYSRPTPNLTLYFTTGQR